MSRERPLTVICAVAIRRSGRQFHAHAVVTPTEVLVSMRKANPQTANSSLNTSPPGLSSGSARTTGFTAEFSLWRIPAICIEMSHWLLLLVVVLLPIDVYFQLPDQSQGVFLSQLFTAEATGVFVLGVVLARIFRVDVRFVPGWRELWPLGLLVVSVALSTVIAHHKADALRDVGKVAFYLLIFLLARSAASNPRFHRPLQVVLIVGFGLVALSGMYLLAPDVPDVPQVLLNIQRVQASVAFTSVARDAATFRFPVEFNEYLLVLLPFLAVGIARYRRLLTKTTLVFLVDIGVFLMYETYTRSGILILLVLIPALVFLFGYRRTALAILTLGILGTAAFMLADPYLARRLTSLALLSSDSSGVTENRLTVWQWAFQVFAHHPLLGVGPRNLQYQPGIYINPSLGKADNTAENSYLTVLAEEGLLGLAAVACVVVGAYRLLLKSWRRLSARPRRLAPWTSAAIMALSAYLLDATVHPPFYSAQVTGLLIVIVALAPALDAAPDISAKATMPPAAGRRTWVPALPGIAYDGSAAVAPGAQLHRRLVFLVNGPGLGGANRHSLNLAQRLQYLGARVLVVVPPGAIAGIEAQHMGLPLRELEMGTNIGRWRGYLGTLSLLNVFAVRRSLDCIQRLHSEEPTLFICPHPREQLLTAWLAPRQQVKAIWVAHSPFHYLAHRLLIHPLWIHASRSAEAVVAVSRGFAGELRRAGIGAGHLYSIPNAVEVSVPRPSWSRVARTPYLIGVAARLVKGKGIQYLIDAMPDIVERYPLAHLAIAGSGRYERALRARVRRLGLENHVTFAGHIQNMPNFYRSLHVFVLPSLSEVLPTVVLEAAIAETAVVATDVGSTAEGMVNGATGLLVKPADVAGLRRAIMRFLDNPDDAIAFGHAGRQFVARQFDMQRVSAAFYALAQQIEQRSLPAASVPEDAALSETREEPREVTLEKAASTGWLGTTNARLLAASHRRGMLGRSGIVLASKLTTAVATACWTIIAARALLPSAYGNLALIAGIVDLGAYLGDAGLQSVAARELASASHEEMRKLLGSTIYLKLLLGVISTGVLFVVVFTLPFGGQADQVMLALGPSMLFASFNTLTLVFRARSALAYLFVVSVAAAVVGIGTTLVAYFLHGDVFAFARAQFAAAVVSSLLLFIVIVWRFSPSLRPNLRQITHLFKTAAPLGFSSALVVMYYRLDVPILGLLANSVQVAMYSNAYRFLDMLALVPASLGAIALPQMSALRRHGLAVVANYCQRYLEIAIILGSLLGMLLSFTAPHLLDLLYGRRYDAATPVLQVLAWAGAATFLTNALSPIAIVLQRSRAMIIIAASGLVVNLAINIVLIPQFGALASAYATLVTEIVVILGFGWVGIRALSWRIHLLLPLGAVIATGVCEYLIMALATQPLWAQAPWPVTAVILFFVWSLCFAPFALMHAARSWRERADAQTTEAPPETMERARAVTNSVWLMAGMLPAPVWTLLANLTQPSQTETDANAETEPELPRPYQDSDDAFRERQSEDPRDWSGMQ